MPIVPAPPIANLAVARDELLVIRDALAEYVQKDRTEPQLDAAWSVLAEIAHRLRREGQ